MIRRLINFNNTASKSNANNNKKYLPNLCDIVNDISFKNLKPKLQEPFKALYNYCQNLEEIIKGKDAEIKKLEHMNNYLYIAQNKRDQVLLEISSENQKCKQIILIQQKKLEEFAKYDKYDKYDNLEIKKKESFKHLTKNNSAVFNKDKDASLKIENDLFKNQINNRNCRAKNKSTDVYNRDIKRDDYERIDKNSKRKTSILANERSRKVSMNNRKSQKQNEHNKSYRS